MRSKLIPALIAVLLTFNSSTGVSAQTQPQAQLPAPNALLIYDKTTVALINISQAPISLAGVTLMRYGGAVKFNAQTMITTLAPGHCFQVWTTQITQVIAVDGGFTAYSGV